MIDCHTHELLGWHYHASAKRAQLRYGEINLEEARKYFQVAADQGHRYSQKEYGRMCYDGKGGDKNFEAARKYLRLCLESNKYNDAKANHCYAIMCARGEGGPKDRAKARENFKLAADDKYARSSVYANATAAANDYAFMCKNGLGGEVDLQEANKYFKLVKEKSNKSAVT